MRSRSPLFIALVTSALIAAPAFAQSPAGTSAAAAPLPVQLRTSFEFELPVPPAQAAPLFGPEGERCWAGGHWDPHFVYPQPAHDQQDAVFTIAHGGYRMIWVNTVFDPHQGHMQYVAIVPEALVSTVDVRLSPAPQGTHVQVTYIRTALDPAANVHITEMAEHDRNSGPEWAHDIESCLRASNSSK